MVTLEKRDKLEALLEQNLMLRLSESHLPCVARPLCPYRSIDKVPTDTV